MAVNLEYERVALDKARYFTAARKSQLPIKLSGVIEAEDVLGLLGEKFFGSGEEAKVGIAFHDGLQVEDPGRIRLHEFGPG